jgi:hypothetical protein
MRIEGAALRRWLLILAVLCATLAAQAASFAAESETHHGAEHCCRLCHIGPAPLVPTAVACFRAPVSMPAWVASAERADTPCEAFVHSTASRAPPNC